MTVYLVGAGPGDPGLMTARSLQLLAQADVIIYDRLIPESALDGARPDAQLIYAGKEGGGEQVPQSDITAMLLEHGRSAELVVRLKGGDPFVFGRGGEEAEALIEAGIAVEVVPGVTAGIAAPAYAGIPVTHRDAASAVAFLTGHEDPEKPDAALDWRSLATFPGTLVVYMGVRQLEGIAARLIAGGRSPQEPAALIQRGTMPGQRSVQGTLETIAGLAAEQQIKAPAIAVFGPVAELHDRLAWLPRRPLHGVTIAVTRAREQGSRLAERLRGLGAEVILAPVIRTQTLPGPAPELETYDLICFTSPSGVEALFERLEAEGLDARAFPARTEARVAAIGPATARALRERGILADVVPAKAVGEALAEALLNVPVTRALVARAREARDIVPDALRDRGAEVDVLAVYETVVELLTPEQSAAAAAADFITFTSASTVRNFLASVGGVEAWLARGPSRPRMVSIGPVTSDELRAHGLEPDVEAEEHDINGLIAALVGG
ncbi:MAG TPA: uroporphyrinogen-III C-methyltransferase [Solirubrobacteraceae bacterium]|nr:uroporphyrinogen-III C-methyltransferase [Solirubrobacteraceae bacterium]